MFMEFKHESGSRSYNAVWSTDTTTMYHETILPDERQEQVEQIIRDVIAGMGNDYEGLIVPSPNLDSSLDIPGVPNLSSIHVKSLEDEQIITMELNFTAPLKTDIQIIPDQTPRTSSMEENPGSDCAEPTWLEDLGGPHKELSDTLINTLTTYLDTPEHNREKWFVSDRTDFICTMYYPEDDLICFITALKYPQFIESVYGEGRRDIAEHLRLPF